MKISGVNISGGIRMHQQAVPSGPSKFVTGAAWTNNNAGSAYIYNLDGTGEVKITASDGADNDQFGQSVAISDTHIVVGAYLDDDSGSDSGSAYVYNLDGTGEVKITASDGASGDEFGYSVAISDTKVVVAARDDDSNRGSAYIYNTDGTGEVKITASDGAAGNRFGSSVAMSDTKIVVGALQAITSGIQKGAAYVYNTDGTGEVKITATDGVSFDYFGVAVAISDTKIVVGASEDDSARGSVYIFNTDGTGELKIPGSSTSLAGDDFGCSVAISDTKVVVGARSDDDNGSNSGSVYVYNLDGTGEVKITASDGAANDRFGSSVTITDTHIVVGANGDDDSGTDSGSVYVYNLDGTGEQKITASDGAANDRFGHSVAAN